MKEVCEEIEIKGSPKRVWKTLADFGLYAMWNPFTRMEGELTPGRRVNITYLQPERKNPVFQAVVKQVEPYCRLRWVYRPRIPLIFESERIITIEISDSRSCRLKQCERHRGLFALFSKRLLNSLRSLLEATNVAVKARVENG